MSVMIETQRKYLEMKLPKEVSRSEVLEQTIQALEYELGLSVSEIPDGLLEINPTSMGDFLTTYGFNQEPSLSPSSLRIQVQLFSPGEVISEQGIQTVLGGQVYRRHKEDSDRSVIYANGRHITPRDSKRWLGLRSESWSVVATITN